MARRRVPNPARRAEGTQHSNRVSATATRMSIVEVASAVTPPTEKSFWTLKGTRTATYSSAVIVTKGAQSAI